LLHTVLDTYLIQDRE